MKSKKVKGRDELTDGTEAAEEPHGVGCGMRRTTEAQMVEKCGQWTCQPSYKGKNMVLLSLDSDALMNGPSHIPTW